MSTLEFARAIQATALGQSIQTADPKLIEGAQLFHVFGLTLVLATVLLLGLRLAGGVLGDVSISRLARTITPLWAAGLLVTVLSGATLFLSAALVYNANKVFWTKIVLLLVAAAVQGTLLILARREQALPAGVARSAGLLSLLLWASVGIAGRAIGFI